MKRRATRVLAATGVGVLLTLTAVASSTAATIDVPTAASSPGSVTVPAPGAGDDASITVSRTQDLVNQTVLVSWGGFRPSSASRLDNSGDSLDVNTENPVRVYQCRGTAPASSSDCYGSPGFRGIEATPDAPAIPPVLPFTYPGQQNAYDATPDGPANWQDNVTRQDGTGEITIQLFTKRESASLGCDATSPCSIVVVPNYGRPQGATEDQMDGPWAWARRTVVPLDFLPVDDACPLTGDSLRVEGSPVAAHALASWRAQSCTLSRGSVRVDYTSIGEPQTRADVGSGTTNVGLVIEPLDEAAAKERAVVYAPVAVTGLVVAFQIDDAEGRPVTDLKLNPRLVAKLITGSYRSGGNPAVIDNPVNFFRDPEFLDLNPGTQWPGGAPGNHPLLLGDLSDTTSALTRWIAADKDARAFLAGKPDPWGMTVNANYKGVDLPFASFPLLDPELSETFEPIQELDALSRQLSIARFPGALVTQEGGVNIVTKPPRQNPGRREVIGIIDAASAARFRLPTAALENGSGAFVRPTNDALLAGVKRGVVNPDGVTRVVDTGSKDPAVYPLTLLVSAALSTKADEPERAEMADLLSYIERGGQVPGEEIGQLPEGHAPLPAALRTQLREARAAVLEGYTAPDEEEPEAEDPDTEPAPNGPIGPLPDTGLPGPGNEPVKDDTPDSAKPPVTTTDLINLSSQPGGDRQMMLPMIALLGVVGLVSGPLVLWLGRTGRGPRWFRL